MKTDHKSSPCDYVTGELKIYLHLHNIRHFSQTPEVKGLCKDNVLTCMLVYTSFALISYAT